MYGASGNHRQGTDQFERQNMLQQESLYRMQTLSLNHTANQNYLHQQQPHVQSMEFDNSQDQVMTDSQSTEAKRQEALQRYTAMRTKQLQMYREQMVYYSKGVTFLDCC